MKEGIAIISQPSGWYPYVQIGWLKHLDGFEWEIHGVRVIRLFGPNVALTTLAEKGPQHGTELLPASHLPELIFRPNVRRCIVADARAWVKECPKPKSWEEGR